MHGTIIDPIIQEAREHLRSAKQIPVIDADGRWQAVFDNRDQAIDQLQTVKDVLHYAQSKVPFNHREKVPGTFLAVCGDMLVDEFHRYKPQILRFHDDPRSLPDSLWDLADKGASGPVSNVYFWHLRSVLICLANTDVDRVCEIGGGHGSLARLFMLAKRTSRYVIIDLPESLFFAEVCLRSLGFDVAYFDGCKAPDNKIVLVPLSRLPEYRDTITLMIAVGSLQEMSQAWVDRYMALLDEINPQHFYSLNYGAQRLGRMAESRNWWSCHPSAQWSARLIAAEIPLVKIMTRNRNFAEHLYVRQSINRRPSDWMFYQGRSFNRQVFLECFDCLRYDSGDYQHSADFVKAVVGACDPEYINDLPKELVYLAARSGLTEIEQTLIKASGGLEQ